MWSGRSSTRGHLSSKRWCSDQEPLKITRRCTNHFRFILDCVEILWICVFSEDEEEVLCQESEVTKEMLDEYLVRLATRELLDFVCKLALSIFSLLQLLFQYLKDFLGFITHKSITSILITTVYHAVKSNWGDWSKYWSKSNFVDVLQIVIKEIVCLVYFMFLIWLS